MIGLLGAAYEWVKAAHIIFVIFWMAGLFMMPRYLVYHQEALRAMPRMPRAGSSARASCGASS